MQIYKEAAKRKIRFQTTAGNLSIEQLWDLPVEQLDTLAVSLDEAYDDSGAKSYLKKTTAKNKDLKLRRDLVVDILTTKVEEADAAREALETKAHNDKINNLIAEKTDEELRGKSKEELEKLLK